MSSINLKFFWGKIWTSKNTGFDSVPFSCYWECDRYIALSSLLTISLRVSPVLAATPSNLSSSCSSILIEVVTLLDSPNRGLRAFSLYPPLPSVFLAIVKVFQFRNLMEFSDTCLHSNKALHLNPHPQLPLVLNMGFYQSGIERKLYQLHLDLT